MASTSTRSRVTPGISSEIVSRRPNSRFTNVDLPTFCRPITATFGRRAVIANSSGIRSRTMAIASRSVSSTVRSLVSRTIASAAGSNGFTFASFVSRRQERLLDLVRVGDPSLLRAPLAPLVRLRGQEQLDGRVREDDRADVSTLDHRAREAERTLTLTHQGTDLRVTGDVRHLTLDAVAHEGGGRCGTLDLDLRGDAGGQAEPQPRHQPGERRAVVGVDVLVERGERQRSIHDARVDVGQAQRLRQPTCQRALPGPGRTVDRDDVELRHVASSTEAPSARMASTNPGNDTSAASMPSISLGPSAASAPTANAIASR